MNVRWVFEMPKQTHPKSLEKVGERGKGGEWLEERKVDSRNQKFDIENG